MNQTIYIVEDSHEICNALRFLFESADFEVKTFSNAEAFLQSSIDKPGCLIVDVRMPGMSGLELLEHIKKRHIHLPVVMMTAYGDISMVVRAMKAGAKDFILKPFQNQALLNAVKKCLQQSIQFDSLKDIQKRLNLLSEREHQIIQLILDGKLNKQIAHELSLSISTVEAHRAHVMEKMEAQNLAHLIKMYIKYQQQA